MKWSNLLWCAPFLSVAFGLGMARADDTIVDAVVNTESTEAQVVSLIGGDAADSCSSKKDSCGSCLMFGPDDPYTLFAPSCSGINVGGWLQVGYHNDLTPASVSRGDLAAFNDLPDGLNVHQTWMYIEKQADSGKSGWDFGYRADFLYGTDAQKTQAYGGTSWDNDWDHGVYGWAIPQLYGEIASGDLSIIGGHFFAQFGHEGVAATDNFFYSRSLTMVNSEPRTHTGILATYQVNDVMEVYGGWSAGWDTGFEMFGNGSSFMGGISMALMDNVNFKYVTTVGNFGARGDEGYSHSIVFDVQLSDRLNYVIQSDLLSIGETGEDDTGINQYVIYTVNDCVAVGGRFEWWQNEGDDYFSATGGINIMPHANIMIRPEIRHTTSDVLIHDNVTNFGIDAIFTF